MRGVHRLFATGRVVFTDEYRPDNFLFIQDNVIFNFFNHYCIKFGLKICSDGGYSNNCKPEDPSQRTVIDF